MYEWIKNTKWNVMTAIRMIANGKFHTSDEKSKDFVIFAELCTEFFWNLNQKRLIIFFVDAAD